MKYKIGIPLISLLVIVAFVGCFGQSADNINSRFGTAPDMEDVTATATELNLMDGVTATTAELNIVDGVTATYSELNYTDVTTAGAAEASKAMILDSSLRATGIVAYADSSFSTGDTLTVADYGKVYTAHLLGVKKTITLPLAALGGNFKFIVDDTDSLIIDANASDKIIDSSTEYEKQTTVAGTVELIAVNGRDWYMVGATGTWTGY